MYHSINFELGEMAYNTWESWRLIPSSRPSVALPKVRTKYLDIPGMNGQLDISTILTGNPLYDNRKGSWEFYLSRRPFDDGTRQSWTTTIHKMAEALHGKNGRVWLEDDPNYEYTGRFAIGEKFNVQKDYSKITIEYTLRPLFSTRTSRWDPINGWLWDPFNFETDEIDDTVTPHKLASKKEYL